MANLGLIRLSELKNDAQSGPVRQRESITRKFAQLGVDAGDITWAEDLDVSAFHVPPLKRPALRRALDALPAGSTIVFYRLDRFVRRVFPDWADMVAFANERKLKLVSATEDLDLKGLTGQMGATMLAFIAQMESENISARVKNTQAYFRQVGRYRGTRPPYGYRPARVEGKAGWYLEVDPEAAAVVRQIFRRVLDGESVNAIAPALSEQGIVTPVDRGRILQGNPRMCVCGHDEHAEACEKIHQCRHRTHTPEGMLRKLHEYNECSEPCPAYVARTWGRSGVEDILRNPAMMGHTVEHGRVMLDDTGVPVSFAPGIVSPEDFALAQDRMDARKYSIVRTNTDSMLLGVAFCDCDAKLYRSSGTIRGKYPYSYYRENDSQACGARRIKTAVLDKLVSTELLKTLGDREVLRKQEPSKARLEIQAELNAVTAQIMQLTRERLERRPLRANHTEMMTQLEARHEELIAALESSDLPEPVLVGTGQTFAERWESMSSRQRRLWLLNSGVRVVAVRGRRPPLNFKGHPVGQRSLIVARAPVHELYVVVYLGNLGELLRRVSA